MNLRWLLPLGLIALLAGLVVYAPAAWLAQQVHARAPSVKMTGITGTALSGRAQYLVVDGTVLRGVEWRLRPAALLSARLAAEVSVTTDTGRLDASVSRGLDSTSRITGAEGSASLGWFGRLVGYSQLPLTGDVRAALTEAVIGDDLRVSHIDGRVQLANTRWQLAKPPIPLGSFGGSLTTEEDTLSLLVEDSDGPLDIDGSAQLIGGDQYRLDMRLRPRAGADDRLKSMLDVLGRPDAEGAYRVRERGRF